MNGRFPQTVRRWIQRLRSASGGRRSPAAPHSGRRAAATLLLPLLLLLAVQLPARSYLYEQTTVVDCPVSNFRVTDLTVPGGLRLEWDYSSLGGGAPTYELERRPAGGTTWTNLGTTTNKYWEEKTFTFGVEYEYRVRVLFDESGPTMGLPEPPPDANPEDIYQRSVASGQPWSTLEAAPVEVVVSENQAVDSRLDPRTGSYLDFQFGTRVFRGGLFLGFANDPSRVGRSFLKFQLPSLPAAENLWVGSVNAYYVRSYTDGTTEVVCQAVDPIWSAAPLRWSNQPVPVAGAQSATVPVTYDSLDPQPGWKNWKLTTDIETAAHGTGLIAFGLTSGNEAGGGWAYFAKQEWNGTSAARVLYCYGKP